MIAFRRATWNFALQHAVDQARQLGKPLVILEPLRVAYPWASDRLHRFLIEGMRANSLAFAKRPVTYYPYVEPRRGTGTGLVERLARNAAIVVTDDYPCFFLPHMVRAVSKMIPVAFEAVDSNGILPLRLADRTFTVAHSYRRWMQKNVLNALVELPKPDPLSRVALPPVEQLPTPIMERWKPADFDELLERNQIGTLPIDHQVTRCPDTPGGTTEGVSRWKRFLNQTVDSYHELRNHPDETGSTGVSPYLHFGHLSVHQMVVDLLDREAWSPNKTRKPNGKVNGFWSLSESAEALLDQLFTWREIGFNLCHREPRDYDQFESLPAWAKSTLADHSKDQRPYIYTLEQFERAETHDPLWNASQRQIVQTGVMHNYLRMLWGKNILHWSESPQAALAIMIELNNKYGLDGRDPNSYSGIFWVLGRYDRAWGPKRPVFGSVRYMTSDSARRKLRLNDFLKQFGESFVTAKR
jgi:deoxyribodipyrimidine photo-lyase